MYGEDARKGPEATNFLKAFIATGPLQLAPWQRQLIRFPNDASLLLTMMLEVPLRGHAWLQLKEEWTPCVIRLARHPGVRQLIQDVLASGCLTLDDARDHMQSFAEVLARHAPMTLASSSLKKEGTPFTEKRKQALTRGFEAGFAKMKLREGHADEAHKKRAEAARVQVQVRTMIKVLHLVW